MSDLKQKVAEAICEFAPARLECEFLPIDPPILAQAALTAVFDWLEEPSGEAVEAGRRDMGSPYMQWQAMLAQMRREAGV